MFTVKNYIAHSFTKSIVKNNGYTNEVGDLVVCDYSTTKSFMMTFVFLLFRSLDGTGVLQYTQFFDLPLSQNRFQHSSCRLFSQTEHV